MLKIIFIHVQVNYILGVGLLDITCVHVPVTDTSKTLGKRRGMNYNLAMWFMVFGAKSGDFAQRVHIDVSVFHFLFHPFLGCFFIFTR